MFTGPNVEYQLLDWFVKKLPEGYRYKFHWGFSGAEIDLWVESDREVWIVEAKKIATYDALGQLLYYKYLYESEKMVKPLKLILVYRDPAAYTNELYSHY